MTDDINTLKHKLAQYADIEAENLIIKEELQATIEELQAALEEMETQNEELNNTLSELEEKEHSLEESELLLKDIAANYPNSYISVIEKDLTVGFTSGQEFTKLGLDPKQFVGMSIEEVFGEYADHVREHYIATFKGEERNFELFINNQHQLYKTVPFSGPDGHIEKILSVVENITERKKAELALKKSEARVRKKLESILSPDDDIGELKLEDMINISDLQALMDDFSGFYNIALAILEPEGKILAASGWQEICTEFHRKNPESCQNCLESDTILSKFVSPGDYRIYKCKNGMWDMVTPIYVSGTHVANLFTGQFFFDTDIIDRKYFLLQAEKFGYDKEKYMEALKKVPVISRNEVESVFAFYTRFARRISNLSRSNIKLAKMSSEKDRLLQISNNAKLELLRSENLLNSSQEISKTGGWEYRIGTGEMFWTEETYRIHGIEKEMIPPGSSEHIDNSIVCYDEDDRDVILGAFRKCAADGTPYDMEFPFTSVTGDKKWIRTSAEPIYDGKKITHVVGTLVDITEKKKQEELLRKTITEKENLLKELFHRTRNNMQVIISMLQLSSPKYNNDDIDELVFDIEKRINSMSIVQGLLHKSGDLSYIYLDDYVHDLIEKNANTSYKTGLPPNVNTNIERIRVLFDIAMPCGLILNELLTNSMKHAFTGIETPEISIKITKDNEKIIIIYTDNGRGLPENFNTETSDSFGMQIIHDTVKHQLGGDIIFTSAPGFNCSIDFTEKVFHKRI